MPTLCKLLFTFILIFFLNSFNFAQSLPELEKLKEIKLLEHTREDVLRIMNGYELEAEEKYHYDWFSTKDADIRIDYSEGNCEEFVSDGFKISEWKAIYIVIEPKKTIKLKDLKIDFSKYKKEKRYYDIDGIYVYYDKKVGVIFTVGRDEIGKIEIIPSEKYYNLMCDEEKAKKLSITSSIFEDKLKDRNGIPYCPNIVPNVENLILSFDEITASCSDSENKRCSDKVKVIAVFAYAKDPENDTMIYKYEISGGRILPSDNKPIDRSEKVLWDLSDVKPGSYTITVAVDDGCGFCGKTMTKTVVVKECPDCKKP